ncbi:MAG: hypothetical protein HY074_03765 [Deltaproteobacteria bacterium]|nr:hypothetical protein [Deltaproteobacteria bacterium]
MVRVLWAIVLACCLGIGASQLRAGEPNTSFDRGSRELGAVCDPGATLSDDERGILLNKLRISTSGRAVLDDFVRQYGSFTNLLVQWDTVSYSQVVSVPQQPGRSPAGESLLGNGVCVHLTRKLPEIEHVADLAHELTHATRLSFKVLHGEVADVAEFVRARLTARGGEADAFSVECKVKHELLGRWDEFCSPYGTLSAADSFDTVQVIKDFYNGRLSASLTGETYPVMLARQYKAMLAKRARVQYATNPYAGK